jgi:hypothetical protein
MINFIEPPPLLLTKVEQNIKKNEIIFVKLIDFMQL